MTPYDKQTVTHRFATFLIDHPWKSILFALALVGVLIPGLARLKTDFSYRIWFRDTDPLLAKFDAFERRFGNDENVVLLLESPSGIFDKDSAELLQKITEDFWKVPEIIRVESLSNYNWTHSEEDDLMVEPLIPDDEELTEALLAERKKVALEHEVIPGYLVNAEGTIAVIYAQLKPAIGGAPDFQTVVDGARALMAKYQDGGPVTYLHDAEQYKGPGDHQFYLTGSSLVSHTFKELTQSDMETMVPVLLGAIVLFLLLSFRNKSGLILPFMVIALSVMGTLGFAGWIGIKFNNLTAIVPHILIAISVADAVHILVTFFQFRISGLERKQAAHKTLVKNLEPTLLTSISTSIGFFSFSSAKIIPIVYMGILAGTGTLLAWFITIFLITPIMAYVPIKVRFKGSATHHTDAHPLAIRYADWLQRNSRMVIGIFVILGSAAVYTALQNEINSDPYKYFATSVHTRVANDYAEQHVGGMSGLEISIDSGAEDGIKKPEFLKKVEVFQNWLDDLPYVTKTISVIDIIKETNRSLNGDEQAAYKVPDNHELIAQELFLYTMSLPQGMDLSNRMSMDNKLIRLTAMTNLHASRQTLIEIGVIEDKARELGLDAEITGKIPIYHSMNPYVVNAFITSISMALVLVALLMCFALRSWKLGMMSMIPNTMPLIMGGAFMYLLGKPLDIGTVLVTSTCLGIAVDDTIHFLSNYNRWRKHGSSQSHAVAHVLTHTGPALFVTTMVLVVAFATFTFASFVPNINFGMITAIVLSTALLTDVTLLPAMLLVGKETVPAPAEASTLVVES